ncbi:isoamylase early set domain-containing protein [Rhodohalobacter sp. 614A]|uniref:isoamylase early set domain-containing protein n=1 Tax=Rhodohalobacter sp. 614A TaxID=2908649 RepID=UPI001F428597|nr:isoamylase early set domain-containing protein [Rhodohalobacter sp. 614A]
MLKKTFTPKRTICKVTFSIPVEWAENSVQLVGDFNDWDKESDSLKKKKDKWEVTLRLKPENEYRFKYLIDGEKWENDDAADKYVANDFGSEDSVVEVGK